MLKTPLYDLTQFPEVYEPSEDSFLLLDALESELTFLKQLQPKLAVEVGSGSGVVITALSQIFNIPMYFAVDINVQACLATKHTATLNKTLIECLNMDLLSTFKEGIFDLILFNPPYVVTDQQEIKGNGINRAWAGGSNGRAIIDKLLCQIPKLLSAQGVFYMLLLEQNQPEEIVQIMQKEGFSYGMVLQRKIPGEHLYVYKFVKENLHL